MQEGGLLGAYRVLDLTDEKGMFCGRILADLGADVVKVEPPEGDRARRSGPFVTEPGVPIPDTERSLLWAFLNAGKRSITLNLDVPSGRALFRDLLCQVDILVESFGPGRMAELGFDDSVLRAIHPELIHTAVTPFGQTGPYAKFKATDLVIAAMAGQMNVLGDPDRAPVRISFPQAYAIAGAWAAVGTLIALHHRMQRGQGQFVDVSAQQAVLWVLQDVHLFWDLTGTNVRRSGPKRRRPDSGVSFPWVWRCRDGYLCFAIIGGSFGAKSLRALVEWMEETGVADDCLRAIDWMAFDWRTVSQTELDPIVERFSRFFEMLTTRDLLEQALRRRIMLYPVMTAENIVEDPQLKARGFWQQIELPSVGHKRFPGTPFKLSDGVVRVRGRAPRVGEHNGVIYGGLGLKDSDLSVLRECGAI